ncbi:MAG TPA: EAL domain-containing protein [Thermoanaerobaculia bacterium]|nr:EAL domain-containing protein [Thermoanaerobaculia bacterium]
MLDPTLALFASYGARAVGAAAMTLLLFGFFRQYPKLYLRHWTLGWMALAVYHLAGAIAMTSDSVRVPAWIISSVAGYLEVGWLLFGAYELARRRPVRISDARRITIGLAALGLATSLFLFGDSYSPDVRRLAHSGIHSLVVAIAFGGGAIFLYRVRRRRRGIGFFVIATAFALTSLAALLHFAASIFRAAPGTDHEALPFLGYLDFLVQAIMGMGMIACLLEDEREASELATVEIEHLAYHDALTGLPNRPLFMDRLIVALTQANRYHQKMAVLFLDLDRFKEINDSLGHSTGDALLKSVAERIRRCVREGDTVARFGGDEFTLLIPKIDNVEDAAKIAQKVLENLKIPYQINDRELFATTSIGISIAPNDGSDAETLVRNADTAMYRAKEQGRDNYQLYAPAMNARALERLALENMLRRALSHQELVVHYQPLIELPSRAIVGVEALLRWRHPQLGLLSPAHFISVAELSGLIVPIGGWVMRTAAKQARIWQKRIDPAFSVAVNLSARQFQQPDLVEQISRVLDEVGVRPSTFELEITESNAMQNAENTIFTLRELKALGVRISMDDFGTGYSSLNYLKRFPIDTLKLDQSFVNDIHADPSDAAIASAVIAMAHSLNLIVVAEGVETEEQLDFLSRQRCDRIQGFLFSAPMSADELEPYLLEQRELLA